MGTKSTAFSSLNVNEPYRATRLWNEIVRAFRAELPRGCHRRRMKTYEDCFVASEAVDWLLKYLQTSPHFGPNVTRSQATQLLQKFLKTDLIQEVHSKKSSSSCFEDNKDLYRVKKSTPLKSPAPHCLKKLLRTPLGQALVPDLEADVQESRDICSGTFKNQFVAQNVERPKLLKAPTSSKTKTLSQEKSSVLTALEVANIWKSVLWNKLSTAAGLQNLERDLNPQTVIGSVILHNATNILRSGIVALKDKSDDIPNWILCAMKCLTKWPNASGSSSCLPNYPGFEKDVFKAIKDYFFALDESLIPSQFYRIVSALYETATTAKKLSRFDSRSTSSSSIPVSLMSELSSQGISRNSVCTKNNSHLKEPHFQNKPIKQCTSLDTVFERSHERASYCFETEFVSEQPTTRIVKRPSTTNVNHVTESKSSSEDSSNPDKARNFLGKKQYRSLERTAKKSVSALLPQRSSSLKYLSFEHWAAPGRRLRFEQKKKQKEANEVYYGNNDNQTCRLRTTSCDNLSIGSSMISEDSAQMRMVIQNPYISVPDQEEKPAHGIARSNSVQLLDKKGTGERPRCSSALASIAAVDSNKTRLLTLPRSHRLVKCFQLVLLLVPVANRRKLHLLLRFLNKIKLNTQLPLFQTQCTSSMLVKMFWTCVLRPANPGTEVDEGFGCQVVEFLLDHCEAILAPPIELRMEVENVVTLLSQSRLRHSNGKQNIPLLNFPVTFCEQVSNEVYEDQKLANLCVSLRGLLEEILTNPLLSTKERTKKLLKFRKQYPEIYAEKFPSDDDSQSKRRNFLRTLKNIRL